MNIIIKTKRSFGNIFMFLPTAVVDMKSEYKIYEISKTSYSTTTYSRDA